jgi:isoleucyl-tRNA synthetase
MVWRTNFNFFNCVVPERPDFPQEEEKVLEFWKEINAFQE